MHNVTVQLASQVDVLYTIKFSFKYDGSQGRSICVFGANIHISLIEFFEGFVLSKVGNLSNICKILIEFV